MGVVEGDPVAGACPSADQTAVRATGERRRAVVGRLFLNAVVEEVVGAAVGADGDAVKPVVGVRQGDVGVGLMREVYTTTLDR